MTDLLPATCTPIKLYFLNLITVSILSQMHVPPCEIFWQITFQSLALDADASCAADIHVPLRLCS